ncbi:MAG: hypothetical protein HY329_16350 [Chloroflexi bacterium]|nr:hypothetical protein [Chloroflexota bacterium]
MLPLQELAATATELRDLMARFRLERVEEPNVVPERERGQRSPLRAVVAA